MKFKILNYKVIPTMTKKIIKKRERKIEVEEIAIEGKIEKYINSKVNKDGKPLASDTASKEIDDLNKLERDMGKSIDSFTEKQLWNFVEKSDNAESSKRKTQGRIKRYLEFYKLPCDLFKQNLTKDVNGVYINIAKESEPIVEAEKKSYH